MRPWRSTQHKLKEQPQKKMKMKMRSIALVMTGCGMSYIRNPQLSIQTLHSKSQVQVNSKRKFFLVEKEVIY
jgi:hypothetical protein